MKTESRETNRNEQIIEKRPVFRKENEIKKKGLSVDGVIKLQILLRAKYEERYNRKKIICEGQRKVR